MFPFSTFLRKPVSAASVSMGPFLRHPALVDGLVSRVVDEQNSMELVGERDAALLGKHSTSESFRQHIKQFGWGSVT